MNTEHPLLPMLEDRSGGETSPALPRVAGDVDLLLEDTEAETALLNTLMQEAAAKLGIDPP